MTADLNEDIPQAVKMIDGKLYYTYSCGCSIIWTEADHKLELSHLCDYDALWKPTSQQVNKASELLSSPPIVIPATHPA